MGQIQGLGVSTYNTKSIASKKADTTKKDATKSTDETKTTKSNSTVAYNSSGDTLEVSKNTNTNGKKQVDEKEVARLIKESNDQTEKFMNFMRKALGNQIKNGITSGSTSAGLTSTVLDIKTAFENGTLEASEADIKRAQELTSEDGYYGVKKTSERILDFAKAVSGGDPEKGEEMREAVQKAFDEVADMWGGMENTLQITKDTYDTVMQGFDDWLGTGTTE